MVTQDSGLPETQEVPPQHARAMFDLLQAKQILNEGNVNHYSDDEVKLITELLFRWAQLTVDTYYAGEDQEG
ncbi:hypothetical protein [Flavisolibacter nicotianae]|uniref:hypothetical protein n=1 Tax=Flavisolibacter nicotianae TaxID=2364882 RepID=UPI000EB2C8BE|nr:hypothetical protein [Flavisolibacter nicotianae]